MVYAERTEVPPERSRAEIERILDRYGATGFSYAITPDRAVVQWEAHQRQVRFVIELPAAADPQFTHTPTGRPRSGAAAKQERDAEVRRRWRVLALCIRAKLEAVASGLVTFEQEFAVHIVLPDNRLVGDYLLPAIEDAYSGKPIPPLLSLEP